MRAYERLLDYVKVYTTSDPESGTHPSAAREFDLAHKLVEELKALGVEDARVDEHCYVYGSLPATPGCEEKPALGDALAEALAHDEEGAEDDGRKARHLNRGQARLEDHRAERHHDHGAAVVEQRGHAYADVAVRLEEKEPCRAERRAGYVEAGSLARVFGRLQVLARGTGKKNGCRERRRAERFFVSSYHIFPALPRVRQARYAFRAEKAYISGRLFAPAQILWYALFCKIVGKQVASPRIFGIRTRHVFIS